MNIQHVTECGFRSMIFTTCFENMDQIDDFISTEITLLYLEHTKIGRDLFSRGQVQFFELHEQVL